MNKDRQNTKEMPIDPGISRVMDWDIASQTPVQGQDEILRVSDLKMHFPVTKGLLKRQVAAIKAVDGVSFSVRKGQTLGIVGESGSGKSTVGNCIMRNYDVTAGQIIFDGKDITRTPKHELASGFAANDHAGSLCLPGPPDDHPAECIRGRAHPAHGTAGGHP